MAQVHLCLASQNMELLALQNFRREAPEFFVVLVDQKSIFYIENLELLALLFKNLEVNISDQELGTIGTTFFESLEIKLNFFFVFDVQNLELLALLLFELIFQDSVKALFFMIQNMELLALRFQISQSPNFSHITMMYEI